MARKRTNTALIRVQNLRNDPTDHLMSVTIHTQIGRSE